MDWLTTWFNELLVGLIVGLYSGIFGRLSDTMTTISGQIGQTPEQFNPTIYTTITGISNTVIVPVAALILSMIFCYELIQFGMQKNNFHDFDYLGLFFFCMKIVFSVFLVSNTTTIMLGIFQLAQHVIVGAGALASEQANMNVDMKAFEESLKAISDTGKLMNILIDALLVQGTMYLASIVIQVAIIGRMLEIYIYCSIAPIPFATFANREWNIGQNYVKNLLALGFQGFFMMICLAIYNALVTEAMLNITSASIEKSSITILVYSFVLGLMLMKTGSISKSIFGGH